MQMKTLEMDDAGSVIMLKSGFKMSPLRLEQIKQAQLEEKGEESAERLRNKQEALAYAIENNQDLDVNMLN